MNTHQPPGEPVPNDGPLGAASDRRHPRVDVPPPHRSEEGTEDEASSGRYVIVEDAQAEAAADPAGASAVGRLAATVERLRREVQAAHAAADGRALIELAKGVLIERFHCGPTEAAGHLAGLAEQTGMSPLELAADIINQSAHDSFAEAAHDFISRTRSASERSDGRTGGSVAVRLRAAESGALAADDTQAVAESVLQHALAPLGATAVAIWAAGHDASLTLAGNAGFAAEEAGRWRYVPPGVETVARRALTERRTVWFQSLAEASVPSISDHQATGGGRVAVPAGAGGRIIGVLEICWPHRLAPQPRQIQRQVEALAELCAHTLETHTAAVLGSPGAPNALKRDLAELVDLVDGLYDPALVLLPHVEADGHLTDFRIHHTNRHFVDPAGRPRSAVSGAMLLEAYPMPPGTVNCSRRWSGCMPPVKPSTPSG